MNRNGVFEYVKNEYGTEPDYPWAPYPGYAVLRHQNRKWYAVLMDVPKHKLGLNGDERADILAVKSDPLLICSLRMRPGFLPAYHMNKNQWISILLDGSVPDFEIQECIDLSFALTKPGAKSQRKKPQT